MQRIEELARDAGKTELLTDNIIKRETDLKHWQDKYFELQHNHETLQKDFVILQKELCEKIEQLKKVQKEKTKLKEEFDKKTKWQFWK